MPLNLQPRWIAPGGLTIFGRPAIFRGTLIFGTAERDCRAISLEDGREVWRFSAVDFVTSDIIVAGGVAYFTSTFLTEPGVANIEHIMVYAVDALTGLQRWRTQLDGKSGGMSILLQGGRLLVPGWGDILRDADIRQSTIWELNPANGSVLRSTDLTGQPNLSPFSLQDCLVVNGERPAVQTFSLIDQGLTVVFSFASRLDAHAFFGRRLYAALKPDASGVTEVLAIDMNSWVIQWTQRFVQECNGLFPGEEGVVMALSGRFDQPLNLVFADAANGATRWIHTEGNRPPADGLFTRGMFLSQTRQRPQEIETTVTIGLDVTTGRLKLRAELPYTTAWMVDTGTIIASSHGDNILGLNLDRFWSIDLPGAVRGTPAASGDKVLVGNADGTFRALALDDGTARWSTQLSPPIEASPAVAGAVVFVGHAGGVSALQVATGQILWNSATPLAVTSKLAVCGSLIVFGCRDRRIRAVASADGALVWSFETGGFVEGGVAFDGARIFMGSDDGTLHAFSLDGAILWTFAGVGEIKSTPLLAADLVIFGNARGLLVALERASGAVRWQKQMPGGLTTNSATLHAEHFWIGDESGLVHRVAVADGATDWTTTRVLGPLRNAVAWSGSLLFVGSLSGSVFVLDIWTGNVLRELSADAPVFAPPVAVADAIIIATEDGHLHALVP